LLCFLSAAATALVYASSRFVAAFNADSSIATNALWARDLSSADLIALYSLVTAAAAFLFAVFASFLSLVEAVLIRLDNVAFFLV